MISWIVIGICSLLMHLSFLKLIFIWIWAIITFKWGLYFSTKTVVFYSTDFLFSYYTRLNIYWKLWICDHLNFIFLYLIFNTYLWIFLGQDNCRFCYWTPTNILQSKRLITYILKHLALMIMKKIIVKRSHY